jgi:hypothetical protein
MHSAVMISIHWVRRSNLRRSRRSAATPAMGPVTKKGKARKPFNAPSNIELPVRS